MDKLNCNVVRDILPLYADEVVCDDTRQLVEEHLSGCGDCRRELDAMREKVVIPAQIDEAESLKKIKRKWGRKHVWKGAIAAFVLLSLLFGGFFWLYAKGLPVSSDALMIRSGLQCVPEYDENWEMIPPNCPTERQTWIIDIGVKEGEIRTTSETIWQENNAGEMVIAGVTIYVRRSPFNFPWDNDGSDWGEDGLVKYVRHGVGASCLDTDAGDFTVTIVCADARMVYSMKDCGLADSTAEHDPAICPWAD